MRKLIIISTYIIFGYFSNAQQIGFSTGVYLSNKEVENDHVAGLNIGFVIDSDQNKRFGFSGGLFYALFQSDRVHVQHTPYSIKRRTNALMIPISFKFNILDPSYKTNSDIWLLGGVIGGSNISRNRLLKHEFTGEKSKTQIEIQNRFLIGIRGGFELSNLGDKAAYAFGFNYDFYPNEIFEERNFSAFGIYFKISLLSKTKNKTP